jgi:copper chaperone
MAETIRLQVAMACAGCSGAVERVLQKTPGVQSVTTSLESQTVVVVTDGRLGKDEVLECVRKTGKACSLLD